MKTKGKFKLKIPLHCCSVNSAVLEKGYHKNDIFIKESN